MTFKKAMHNISFGIDCLHMENLEEFNDIAKAETELYRMIYFLEENNINDLKTLKIKLKEE